VHLNEIPSHIFCQFFATMFCNVLHSHALSCTLTHKPQLTRPQGEAR
jgi:hypothetical protein